MSVQLPSFVEQKEQNCWPKPRTTRSNKRNCCAGKDFVNRNLRGQDHQTGPVSAQLKNGAPRQAESWDQVCPYDLHSDKTSGNVVLTVEDGAVGYDNQILSEPINLDIRKMDAAQDQQSKSNLIKSIVKQIPYQGRASF